MSRCRPAYSPWVSCSHGTQQQQPLPRRQKINKNSCAIFCCNKTIMLLKVNQIETSMWVLLTTAFQRKQAAFPQTRSTEKSTEKRKFPAGSSHTVCWPSPGIRVPLFLAISKLTLCLAVTYLTCASLQIFNLVTGSRRERRRDAPVPWDVKVGAFNVKPRGRSALQQDSIMSTSGHWFQLKRALTDKYKLQNKLTCSWSLSLSVCGTVLI